MWASLFRDGRPRHSLRRDRLIDRVLDPETRWVAISGDPGSGRSTLLRQAQARCAEVPGRRLVILDAPECAVADAVELEVRRLLEGTDTDTDDGIDREPPPQLVVALDGFDRMAGDGGAERVLRLLRATPQLRVITTALEPLCAFGADTPDADGAAGETGRGGAAGELAIAEIDAGQLAFSRREIVQLAELHFGSASGVAERVADYTLAQTGGLVAATAFHLERHRETGSPVVASAETMQRIPRLSVAARLEQVPEVEAGAEPPSGTRELGLLPVIRPQDVQCSGAGGVRTGEAERRLRQRPGLALSGTGDGEVLWRPEWWQAWTEAHRDRPEVRAALAERLRSEGDPLGALWQRIILEDWEQTEELLAARFALAFESLPAVILPRFIVMRIDGIVYPLTAALQSLLAISENLSGTHTTGTLREILRSPQLGRFLRRGDRTAHRLTLAVVQAEIVAAIGVDAAASPQLRRAEEELLAECARRRAAGSEAAPEAFAIGDLVFHLAELGARLGLIDMPLRVLLAAQAADPEDAASAVPEVCGRELERRVVLDALRVIAGEEGASPGSTGGLPRHQRTLGAELLEYAMERELWERFDRGDADACARAFMSRFTVQDHRARRGRWPGGVPPLAGLTAMTLTGRVREARAAFDVLFPGYDDGARHPDGLREWMHRLIGIAEQRPELAAPPADGPPGTELGRSSLALAAYAFELPIAVPAEPPQWSMGEGGLRLPRFAGLRMVAEAAALLRRGDPVAAGATLDRAVRQVGGRAVGFGLRLIHADDRAGMLGAAGVLAASGELPTAAPTAAERSPVRARRHVALTRKEKVVLLGVAAGMGLPQLAEAEHVSLATVRSQLRSAMRKLEVSGGTRQDAVAEARRLGLL